MSMSQKASTEVASPGNLSEKPTMAIGSAGAGARVSLLSLKGGGDGQEEGQGDVSGVVVETDGVSKS
jgi:hypothetical protein